MAARNSVDEKMRVNLTLEAQPEDFIYDSTPSTSPLSTIIDGDSEASFGSLDNFSPDATNDNHRKVNTVSRTNNESKGGNDFSDWSNERSPTLSTPVKPCTVAIKRKLESLTLPVHSVNRETRPIDLRDQLEIHKKTCRKDVTSERMEKIPTGQPESGPSAVRVEQATDNSFVELAGVRCNEKKSSEGSEVDCELETSFDSVDTSPVARNDNRRTVIPAFSRKELNKSGSGEETDFSEWSYECSPTLSTPVKPRISASELTLNTSVTPTVQSVGRASKIYADGQTESSKMTFRSDLLSGSTEDCLHVSPSQPNLGTISDGGVTNMPFVSVARKSANNCNDGTERPTPGSIAKDRNVPTTSVFYAVRKSPRSRAKRKLSQERDIWRDVLSQYCCNSRCLRKLSFRDVTYCEETVKEKNETAQRQFVLDSCHTFCRTYYTAGRKKPEIIDNFVVRGWPVCMKAWRLAHNISEYRMTTVLRSFVKGYYTATHGNWGRRKMSVKASEAQGWMLNEFKEIGTPLPHKNEIHLPSTYTRRSLYDKMVSDFKSRGIKSIISYPYFTALWKRRLPEYKI